MMQLKYLVDDRPMVLDILSRWEYDADNLDLLNHYRISANAVYPFTCGGAVRILRFAPAAEKSLKQVRAELDFLRHLRGNGYPVPNTVFSRQGEEVEVVQTAIGPVYAQVFTRVPGAQLDLDTMDETTAQGWGAALGRLHALSEGYEPDGERRIDWCEQMAWMRGVFEKNGAQDALAEWERVNAWLSGLPVDRETYGLIHYDFEDDNVFLDAETGIFHAIDFDDALYHWYAVDVAVSLSCLEELPRERADWLQAAFLAGYRQQRRLGASWEQRFPHFRRYMALNSCARLLHALGGEAIADPPQWMVQLRAKLDAMLRSRREGFLQPW